MKELKRKQDEEETAKRPVELMKHFTIDEVKQLEKEIGKPIGNIIFNSEINNWNLRNETFQSTIDKHSQLLFLVETTEGMEFGCYIKSEISMIGKYIIDSNAFIFKMNSNNEKIESYENYENVMEKYPIKDNRYAIKISYGKEDDLFTIGRNDIVIKKKEKKDQCYCKQTSYNYNSTNQNVLLARNGCFDIKKIIVFEMKLTNADIFAQLPKSSTQKFKIVCLGDCHVGKTVTITKATTNEIPSLYTPTVLDNYTKTVTFGDTSIELEVLDTAGSEDYDQLRPVSYPQTHLFLIFFAVEKRQTFHSIENRWLNEIAQHSPNTKYILVGTIYNDSNPRNTSWVKQEEAEELKMKLSALEYIEVCLKNQNDVENLFERVVIHSILNEQN